MRASIKAVFFDLDGVLVDSLPAHLDYCARKAREFGLDLEMPAPDRFRELVASGVRVSPMEDFFRAVGFTGADAIRADLDYQREFAELYDFQLFPDVGLLLEQLSANDIRMGIITSNNLAAVHAALGSLSRYLAAVYSKDQAEQFSKSRSLVAGSNAFQVDIRETLYVGDQPADHFAAREAGAQFVGVSYGWGISRQSKDVEVVDNLKDLLSLVLPGHSARPTFAS